MAAVHSKVGTRRNLLRHHWLANVVGGGIHVQFHLRSDRRVAEGSSGRLLTIDEIQRYGREAGVQFCCCAQENGLLRLLIDLSEAHILSQEFMDPLAKAGMQYARADDRAALAVASTLLKLQMRRMLADAPVPIFLSTKEAIDWLLSDAQASAAG